MASTAVDVKELPAAYVFVADMPGLTHADIKVFQSVAPQILTLNGKRIQYKIERKN
jgi:HSP20 family protein